MTGNCPVGKFGEMCENICSDYCRNGCLKLTGTCQDGCNVGKFGEFCNETCDARHEACFNQDTRNCKCKPIFKEYILKVVCVIIGLIFCIKCKNCGLIFIQACSKVHVMNNISNLLNVRS